MDHAAWFLTKLNFKGFETQPIIDCNALINPGFIKLYIAGFNAELT